MTGRPIGSEKVPTARAGKPEPVEPVEPVGVNGDPTALAWADYLAAAQRLDAVRQAAATAAGEQARSVQAAREELTQVRARLVPQQSRLRSLGIPEAELQPTVPELAATAQEVSAGPAAVLTALRRARAAAGAAEVRITGAGGLGFLGQIAAHWPAWVRNLTGYVPFALLALVGQVALFVLADGGWLLLVAGLAGLLLPVAAFGAGWLAVGVLFETSGSVSRVDRTPLAGALVCLAPALLVCLGAGVLSLLA
ncbi:hypothetical protein GCM10027280_34470 [Micromonospora polyrhachis]|uniref:Uncharacterized protein n=1 Tax=Micromonospora polyrhachis TaxID=1282883 RepID=A0A7W7WQ54_9ACTN|nr:hypothetical protein [Micromonospora polyrhachis]MBB4959479.1 hypothetical protein [Micromonospora polyrhachis]